jgi:hypothetical protein
MEEKVVKIPKIAKRKTVPFKSASV